MKTKKESFFWTSYSDLMTSLFFVMLVLFVLALVIVKSNNKKIAEQNEELIAMQDSLRKALADANVTIEQQKKILQIEEQFKILSNESTLGYDEEKRIFYATEFMGVEIFAPNQDVILPEFLPTVDKVGKDLEKILSRLHSENPDFKYQLVIEGYAAIKHEKKISGTYNPDNPDMYLLSYRRSLALYNKWKNLDLRKYNTEIIIAGSGFNGINRDNEIEDNNKRFVIQIIPKIAKQYVKK